MRATILLGCPPESARRYATLLSALEDVAEVEAASEMVEVALLKIGGGWREPAAHAGIGIHEDGDMIVASGEPDKLEAWLAGIEEDLEDVVRLGPVARPGDRGV